MNILDTSLEILFVCHRYNQCFSISYTTLTIGTSESTKNARFKATLYGWLKKREKHPFFIELFFVYVFIKKNT